MKAQHWEGCVTGTTLLIFKSFPEVKILISCHRERGQPPGQCPAAILWPEQLTAFSNKSSSMLRTCTVRVCMHTLCTCAKAGIFPRTRFSGASYFACFHSHYLTCFNARQRFAMVCLVSTQNTMESMVFWILCNPGFREIRVQNPKRGSNNFDILAPRVLVAPLFAFHFL